MHYLFVYGTLMKEFELSYLLNGTVLLGRAKTNGQLFDLGDWPGMIQGSQTVWGELYQITPKHLALLDEAEDCFPDSPERSMFVREKSNVILEKSLQTYESMIYFYALSVEGCPTIQSGNYREYRKKRENTLAETIL